MNGFVFFIVQQSIFEKHTEERQSGFLIVQLYASLSPSKHGYDPWVEEKILHWDDIHVYV